MGERTELDILYNEREYYPVKAVLKKADEEKRDHGEIYLASKLRGAGYGGNLIKGGIEFPYRKDLFQYLLELEKYIPYKINYSPEFVDAVERHWDYYGRALNEFKMYNEIKGKIPNNGYSVDSKLPLMEHQKQNVKAGTMFPSYGLFWHMGTGKTATVIKIIEAKKKLKLISNAIVVVPATIINGWIDECEKFSNMRAVAITGTRPQKIEKFCGMWDFCVISYDSLASLMQEEEFWDVFNEKTFLVADESSLIKNHEARRTRSLLILGRIAYSKMILTGTVAPNHLSDIWTQIEFLYPGMFLEHSHKSFMQNNFRRSPYTGKLMPRRGVQEGLSELMFSIGSRIRLDECVELPDKQYIKRNVYLSSEEKRVYIELRDAAIAEIEAMPEGRVVATYILVRLLRLAQVTSGHVNNASYRFNLGYSKLKALDDIIEGINFEEEQLVIWARFSPDYKRIRALIEKRELRLSEITGEVTSTDKRHENEVNFREGKADVFLGNPQSGGYGINLPSTVGKRQTVIYYNNDLNFGNRVQSEARTYRKGQEQKVTYIDLVAVYEDEKGKPAQTVDHVILKNLEGKKNVHETLNRDNIRQELGG